jgi:long-chain acyl-CoA synthetase
MNSVEEMGAKAPIEPPNVTPETVATICYTSVRPSINLIKPKSRIRVFQGTTGNPKGAVLTQGALASATYSNTCGMDFTPFAVPVLLSFLPLAHIYGVRLLS